MHGSGYTAMRSYNKVIITVLNNIQLYCPADADRIVNIRISGSYISGIKFAEIVYSEPELNLDFEFKEDNDVCDACL